MNDMQILYKQDDNSATVVLEVIRFSKSKKIKDNDGLWSDAEQALRNLLEKNFEKDNRYNTKYNWGLGRICLDRITIFSVKKILRFQKTLQQKQPGGTKKIREKEKIHYHVYQGAKEHLDETLRFCKNNNIPTKQGIGNNLKEKYGHMRDKNIKELLKL